MTAIVAMTNDRVIGRAGKLPWHLPGDLKFFKETTLGHVVLMGRVTFESIGRPLPGRECWVLSRGLEIPGVRTIRLVDEMPEVNGGRRIYLIGGANVFSQLLPRCSEILLTRVFASHDGDAFFPRFEEDFERLEILREEEEFQIERWARVFDR